LKTEAIAEPYIKRRECHLGKGRIEFWAQEQETHISQIQPQFRGVEVHADVILKRNSVDGILHSRS
jgi:hypothetical protein